MPLVERYNDWDITDGSFDDPHTLEFDHRLEADLAKSGPGLVNVEDNVKATCVITILRPEFGWTRVGNSWRYDPTNQQTDLHSRWRDNLPKCVQHDRNNLEDCFCKPAKHPATAYTGPEAKYLPDKMSKLDWPEDTTEFVGRFLPAGQYMIGPSFCSAYHLGEGYVGTAGHVLDTTLVSDELDELRAVFNWVGDVDSKQAFTESEVFKIERVVICDTHGPASPPTDPVGINAWSNRWDSAIFKLIGSPDQFSQLKCTKYSTRPPAFGDLVYSIGSPFGTQLKVSPNAHVLRHSLTSHDKNPFSHQIAGLGTFTTDLDQFEGNSGGPVFDASTGYVVGHTSSTQNAVAECEANDIESWAREYAKESKNYALAADINRILKKQEPNNRFYRIHPKFLRTLSGKPFGNPLISCATNICPGDLGPNGVMKGPGKHRAVLSRHHFNTKDVFLRNVTARVTRNAISLTPLNVLASDFDNCTLTARVAGKADALRKPDAETTLKITSNTTDWTIERPEFHKDTSRQSIPSGMAVWSVTLDLAAFRREIPAAFLNASRGILDWTSVRLEQPTRNPPLMVGLKLSVRRPSFAFAVNQSWPPGRPDVTDPPPDIGLEWPEETFELATTAGHTGGVLQSGGCCSTSATEGSDGPESWIWEAPLDRVWTDPRQHSQGLRDSFMDDLDAVLV